jgi:hypothetical protein
MAGLIPYFKIGRAMRFKKYELDTALNTMRIGRAWGALMEQSRGNPSPQPQHMRTWVLAVRGDLAAMAVGVLLESVQDMRPYP